MANAPVISSYMTRQPWTVGVDTPLADALELMRARHLRHLPVLAERILVGLISERDVIAHAATATVEDVMTTTVYAIPASTPLDTVLRHMATTKVGSAVITTPEGEVEGIFTTVDAIGLLADALEAR